MLPCAFFALPLRGRPGLRLEDASSSSLLSVLFAFLTQKTLRYSYEMEEVKLSKGDYCELRIKLRNKSIFPTTFIEVVVENGDGVFCEDQGIVTVLMPFSTK